MTNEQLAIYLKHVVERLEDGMITLKDGLIEDLPVGKWDASTPASQEGLTFKTYGPLLQLEYVLTTLHEDIEGLASTH